MSNNEMLGRVLGSSYDDDGFLGVQIEVFGSKSVGFFELSNPHGFQSRPLDPDANGACQAYYWYEGSRGYARLANDPRTQSLLPQSQKGETFLHGPTCAFIRFKLDGSISLFTTDDNTTNGRSVYLTLSPTGLEFNFPFGKLTYDANGFHAVTNSGARLDLGALTAPAPLNIIPDMSYATLSASITHIEGSAVHVGTADPTAPAQPVSLANSSLALAAALHDVLTAIGSPGGIVSPPSGGPCTAGPALVAALATATGVLAAASVGATPAAGPVASLSSTASGAP
jgi:hypothetical protein